MQIQSPTRTYDVLRPLGGTDTFTLYQCTLDGGQNGIIKIATDVALNGLLDREALILGNLAAAAEEIEAAAAEAEPGKGELGYRRIFPDLVESFILEEQGGRRVNVLSLVKISGELGDLVPLGHLRSREDVRVDPKTSVWIMGRLLKLLDFAHRQGVTVTINGDNVLITRLDHVVAIFDWSESVITDGPVPEEAAREAIALAAREVISALGGDPDSGTIPPDEQLVDDGYQNLLSEFANGSESDAGAAHRRFYEFVRSIWPRKYHPFTTRPVR